MASNGITGGLKLVCGRRSPDKLTTNNRTNRMKHKRKAKRTAGIEGRVVTMLESRTRQIDTIEITAMKRARKKCIKNNYEETKQKCRLGTASNKITEGGGGGLQLVCGRPTLALSSALVSQTVVLVCVEDS